MGDDDGALPSSGLLDHSIPRTGDTWVFPSHEQVLRQVLCRQEVCLSGAWVEHSKLSKNTTVSGQNALKVGGSRLWNPDVNEDAVYCLAHS